MYSVTYCKLDNGTCSRYDLAQDTNSPHPDQCLFNYIGDGTIEKVNGKPYNGKTRLSFFRAVKGENKWSKNTY